MNPLIRPRSAAAAVAFTLLLLLPAAASAGIYATCADCHALPFYQARGEMGFHGGYPYTPEIVCSTCHMPGSHDEYYPSFPPYLWSWWITYPDPSGRSVITQMCVNGTCHTGFEPASAHPYDHIPYFPITNPLVTAYEPTSVLPLYDAAGQPVQDPNFGGIVCTTCHDPHDPSYPVEVGDPPVFKPSYLRIGSPYELDPKTTLCTYCHPNGPPYAMGEDLWIDRGTQSVAIQATPDPYFMDILVTVKNRGNAPYSGGYIDVIQEDEFGLPLWMGQAYIPFLAPEESGLAAVPWPVYFTGERVVFRFVLPSSPLNLARTNEFVRSFAKLPAAQLSVMGTGSGNIGLNWNIPYYDPAEYQFNVYRDGTLITPMPISGWFYSDWGLAPDTPHTYTVETIDPMGSGFPSMSNRVGAATAAGLVRYVPGEFATIGAAIAAASPGTTIRVAPGTYAESIYLGDRSGITIKGQDANGCTLDLTGGYLDLGYSDMGNTLAGFTLRGGDVWLQRGDVLYGCVVEGSVVNVTPDQFNGVFISNCIFDAGAIWNGSYYGKVQVANSIFTGPDPLQGWPPDLYHLLNNDFVDWYGWQDPYMYPGENNFSAPVYFIPGTHVPYPGPPCFDAGTDVGLPFMDGAPDLGPFESGMPVTPLPPSGLTAAWEPGLGGVLLAWTPAPDADFLAGGYWIYRRPTPDFPSYPMEAPYATVMSGIFQFVDAAVAPGETWYYQVRAWGGPTQGEPVLSVASNTAVVTSNTQPVAVDDYAVTPENTMVPVFVLDNDSDPDGDVLTVTAFGQGSNGMVQDGGGNVLLYMPAPDFLGTDSFIYTVSDGNGGSATATVFVDVTPVNDPPVAADDTAVVAEDNLVPVFVLANDYDPDGDVLTVTAFGQGSNGMVQDGGNNVLLYMPAPDFFGTDSFTYAISDGNGGSATATVFVTVTTVNDPPAALDDFYAIPEDQASPMVVLDNDLDPDLDSLYMVEAGQPLHGQVQIRALDILYTPDANYYGPDFFTYTITDGHDGWATATVYVTVMPYNDPPVAVNDTASTAEDAPVDIAVLANDSDVDGDALSISSHTLPSHGTAAINGSSIRYNPLPDYNGADTFSYTVADGNGGTATATVSVTVTPVNDAPVAVDDAAATMAFAPVTIPVLANDADVEGDPLAVISVTQGSNGSTEILPDGTLRYTPAGSFTGTDTFSYTVSDGQGGSATAAVAVNVRPQWMRIPSITMTTFTSKGTTSAQAGVRVVDEAGNLLRFVTVSGHWSGLTSDSDSGFTGDDGQTTLSSDGLKNPKGTFTFTVDSAVKEGYALDASGSVLQNSIDYPSPPGTMHVFGIAMNLASGKRGTSAKATVTVVDVNNWPVASATVTAAWSGAATGTSSGNTDASGMVTLSSPLVKVSPGATFTVTVTGVSKSGWTYDPAANVETSDSITVP